jgi:hypothetical protein
MTHHLRALSVVFLIGSSLAIGQSDAPSSAAFNQFALNWIAASFDLGTPLEQLKFDEGQLPQTWNPLVVIPADAQVLGSVTKIGQASPASVILTLPQPQSQVFESYSRALIAQGWRDPSKPKSLQDPSQLDTESDVIVLQSTSNLSNGYFCKTDGKKKLVLNFSVGQLMPDQSTLILEISEQACFDEQVNQTTGFDSILEEFPYPEDVKYISGADGGGSRSMSDQIVSESNQQVFRTSKKLEVVADFYKKALKKLGWKAVTSHGDAKGAWSSWLLQKQNRQFTVTVTITPVNSQGVYLVGVMAFSLKL